MHRRTRERIRKTAKDLLQSANVNEPPIPVERIARLLGAQIRYVAFEDEHSGLLFQEDEKIIIGTNTLHSRTRQRFTIAHEIGHLKLHSNDELFVDRNFRMLARDERSAQGIDLREIQANAFAAELLMPKNMLEDDLEGHVFDYEDDEFIRQLADRYEVSLQAMIFRLTNLGYIQEV